MISSQMQRLSIVGLGKLGSPIANCYAGSWIGNLKQDCLHHFACFSLGHLDHTTRTYVSYYNAARPHQSLDNVLLDQTEASPPAPTSARTSTRAADPAAP